MTTLLLLLAGIGFFAWFIDRSPAVVEPDYERKLASLHDGTIRLMQAGGVGASNAIEQFSALWSDLTVHGIEERAPKVYAPDVWFNDTVKTITNRADLMSYLVETAERVHACRVKILGIARDGDDYFVRWKMSVQLDEAKPAKSWDSIGVTHLVFNEQGFVVMHQDYWDSAGGLYEHLPGIGWIIRNIRARL